MFTFAQNRKQTLFYFVYETFTFNVGGNDSCADNIRTDRVAR